MSDFLTLASRREQKKKVVKEIDIEDTFVKYAESKGCYPCKLRFLVGRGWPDRTIFCPGGRIFFVEFKRKGKTIVATQTVVRRKLEKLGFHYYMADTIGQAELILDRFL